jgi:hypothetical protein
MVWQQPPRLPEGEKMAGLPTGQESKKIFTDYPMG